MGRARKSDLLCAKLRGPVSALRRLRRQNSAWNEAGRHPGRAADQVRTRRQPDDRQGTWPHDPGDIPRARRRGDRMTRAPMQRRSFLTLLGTSAAAWPLAARAQQDGRVRRIGVLMNLPADDPEGQTRNAAFLQGLQEAGWSSGRPLRIEYRWAAGETDRFRRYAAELTALAPEVILASGNSALEPLQQATRTLPIVFASVTDPVGGGYVASLARPGGNATGFTLFEYGMSAKWLELLRQIAPAVTRAAVLRDRATDAGIGQFAAIQSVAPSLRVELSPLDVRDIGEIERAITAFARTPNGGLIVTASTHANIHRE